jgi:ATP-dependent protease ClpP protease subunit
MKRIDAGLMARVQALLDARQHLPRVQNRRPIQTAEGDDVTDLMIYDEISWFGICAQDVVDALAGIKGNLNVRINSPGGDVFDGVAIYNALAAHDGDVTVTVDGLAASAASFIAMAGDAIRMNRGAQMMIHDASGLCIGNAADMTEMAGLLNRVSDTIAGIYADRTGVDAADWRTRMCAETWYNADEAVEAGLATEMAPSRHRGKPEPDGDEPEDKAKAWDLTVFQYAGRTAAPPPSLDTAVGPHDTATTDGTWDASAQQKKLPSPMPVATARKMYAAYDDDKVEDGNVPKGACHLPHHEVSADGTPGAAVMNGVRNALARLSQTEGLSDAERATAERHLRAHLKAGGGDDAEDDLDLSTWEVVDETGENTDPVEPQTGPAREAEPIEPAEPDDWAAATAHLTTPDADGWAASVAQLTEGITL